MLDSNTVYQSLVMKVNLQMYGWCPPAIGETRFTSDSVLAVNWSGLCAFWDRAEYSDYEKSTVLGERRLRSGCKRN